MKKKAHLDCTEQGEGCEGSQSCYFLVCLCPSVELSSWQAGLGESVIEGENDQKEWAGGWLEGNLFKCLHVTKASLWATA